MLGSRDDVQHYVDRPCWALKQHFIIGFRLGCGALPLACLPLDQASIRGLIWSRRSTCENFAAPSTVCFKDPAAAPVSAGWQDTYRQAREGHHQHAADRRHHAGTLFIGSI